MLARWQVRMDATDDAIQSLLWGSLSLIRGMRSDLSPRDFLHAWGAIFAGYCEDAHLDPAAMLLESMNSNAMHILAEARQKADRRDW